MKNIFKHWYNKLPEIGYQMKPYVKGGKTFLPSRGKGNYNATIYSGRGIKFNGTDQNILISDIEAPVDVAFFTMTSSTINTLIFNCWISRIDVTNNLSIKYYDDNVTYNQIIATNTANKENFCVIFDRESLLLSIYADGKLADTIQIIAPYHTGVSKQIGTRNSTVYIQGIVKNIIYMKGTLTQPEIQYQHTNPEKFLYHEKQANGTFVSKSEILSQEKIDNVVSHFPMCETDMFVRDMIKYSETQVSGTIATGASDDDEVSTYTKNDDTSYDLAVTTAGTNTARPYLAHHFVVSNSAFHYRISFDVVVNSGTPILKRLYNGNAFDIYETLKTGHYEYVMPAGDDSYQYLVQYFDGTELFDISITNFRVDELTATHPIENYTETCNATRLSTGLQTCFWKRDKLGVSVGSSFKEISFDENGYIDTGWVPDCSIEQTIELVIELKEGNIYQMNGSNYVRFGIVGNSFYRRVGDSQGTISDYVIGDLVHCVIHYRGDTYDMIFNGGEKSYLNISYTATSDTATFKLGTSQWDKKSNSPIRLFNVYTEPQDATKLYADAVRRGIVPEKLEVH